MENKFNSPIKGEYISYEDSSTKKEGKYRVFPSTMVFAPFDGDVVTPKKNCNNAFRIRHQVNNETYYSNFCNLGKQNPSFRFVRKDTKIGETENENLEYWITNDRNEKQNIGKFFLGFSSSSDKSKDDTKSKETKKPKEDKSKENKQKEKKEPKTTDSSTTDEYPPTPFFDLLLSPLALVPKFNMKGSTPYLKENIERIKQLMK